MTFNNILRIRSGVCLGVTPVFCTSLLLSIVLLILFTIDHYDWLVRPLTLIPSFFMMCSIRAPNWHIVSLVTIVFLDGSTLNFTLNKILFVLASCVMSSLTRHSIALLSVMTFILHEG